MYLDRVAATPTAYLSSGMFMVLEMASLVTTSAALIRLAAGRRRAALVRIGAILIGVWGIFGVAGVGLGYTAGWLGASVRGDVPIDVLSKVFEGVTYSPWGLMGGVIGGAAYVLGVIITGIGLLVTREIPTWTGIVLFIGLPGTFIGGPLGIQALGSVAFVLIAVGLAGTIPTLLRTPPLDARAPAAVTMDRTALPPR